jgi:hypothetical protein
MGSEIHFLIRKWISFECDGASNLLGRCGRVTMELLDNFTNIIVCIAAVII